MKAELNKKLDRLIEEHDCNWSHRAPTNGREYATLYLQRKPSYTVDELISIQTGRNNGQGAVYSPQIISKTLKDLRKARLDLNIARFSKNDMLTADDFYEKKSPTFITFFNMKDIWEI